MRLTRQEDRSVYVFLRDKILSPEFGEYSAEMGLTLASTGKWDMECPDDDLCPFKRDGVNGEGRGLLYYDVIDDACILGTEQSQMVTVYDGSLVLTRGADYQVNYLTGQVYSTIDLSTFMVDYAWSYVAVVDEFPYLDVPPLPVVSIELQRATEFPQQLGEEGGIRDASWHIEIFANNKGERDDILEVIFQGLKKRCPIYTFDGGLPLTREGTYNSDCVLENHALFSHLNFENIEKSLTGLPSWGFYETEVINKYRAAISFDSKAYKK